MKAILADPVHFGPDPDPTIYSKVSSYGSNSADDSDSNKETRPANILNFHLNTYIFVEKIHRYYIYIMY